MPSENTSTVAAPPPSPAVSSPFKYDVFISYSREADGDWVRNELIPQLEEVQLRVCIDEQDFDLGAPLVDLIEEGVLKSRYLLAIITPSWLEREWTTHERHLVSVLDPSGRQRKLIPLLLKDATLPVSIKALNYLDCRGDRTKRQGAIERLRKELVRSQLIITEAVTGSARKSLVALSQFMRRPEVHGAVEGFQDARRNACKQIVVLNRYKGLHECFHNAESRFEVVRKLRNSPQDNTQSWRALRAAAFDLKPSLGVILEFAQNESFPPVEISWTDTLESARGDLLEAIDRQDSKFLDKVIRRIWTVVGQVPNQLSFRLFSAAADLPLSKLVQELEKVGQSLGNLGLADEDAKKLEEFKKGIHNLEELSRILKAFVDNHTCLQKICNELSPFEPSSIPGSNEASPLDDEASLDPEEFQPTWRMLKTRMDALTDTSGSRWIKDFRKSSTDLDEALTQFVPTVSDPKLSRRIYTLFCDYRCLVTQGFMQVDQDLKRFCKQLESLGESLSESLEELRND